MTAQTSGTSSESPGGTVRYSVPQAARYLGISERAVRKRIDAGTLFGTKEGKAWVIHLDPGTAPAPGTSSAHPEPGPQTGTARSGTTSVADDNIGTDAVLSEHPSGTRAVPDSEPEPAQAVPPVDLRPLVDLVAELTRKNAELTEAATLWQFRARHLEDQIRQLTAGDAQEAAHTSAPATERGDMVETGSGHHPPVTSPQSGQKRRSWWQRLTGD